jgi:hypothetical protein
VNFVCSGNPAVFEAIFSWNANATKGSSWDSLEKSFEIEALQRKAGLGTI